LIQWFKKWMFTKWISPWILPSLSVIGGPLGSSNIAKCVAKFPEVGGTIPTTTMAAAIVESILVFFMKVS